MSAPKFKAGDVIRLKKEQKDDYNPSHLRGRDLIVKRSTSVFVYFDDHQPMRDGWLHERFEYAHGSVPNGNIENAKPVLPNKQSQKNHAWALVDKAEKVRHITTTRKSARELKAMINSRSLKIRKIEFAFAD